MEIYVTFEQMVTEYFAVHHMGGEICLTLYFDKQIAVIFSVSEKSDVTEEDVFEYLQDTMQKLYEDSFLKDGIYCNQTFVLKNPVTREEIPESYRKLQEMSKISFFLDKPGIIWPEYIEEKKTIPDTEEIRQIRMRLFQAINNCDRDSCQMILEELFLGKIKSSFDFYLLEENLISLKRFYEQIYNVYDIPMPKERNALFDAKRYPKIEQLTEKILEAFGDCMDNENRKGRRYSRIVRECIHILKANFCRPDISLTYVAEQLNISPGYLSSSFNKEVHSNIARYVIKLRIEKAKELLRDNRMNIGEIADAVGFENKRYFSQRFKQETRMTPKEYRNQEGGEIIDL